MAGDVEFPQIAQGAEEKQRFVAVRVEQGAGLEANPPRRVRVGVRQFEIEIEGECRDFEIDRLFGRIFRCDRAAQKRVEFRKHRIGACPVMVDPVAAFPHEVAQYVVAGEEQFQDCGIGHQIAAAHLVQSRLEPVGEADEAVQPECACAALDRMHRTEHDIDRLAVACAVIHRLQAVLQGFEQFFAFDEERGPDFRHRIGHDLTPLPF